ncbi:MAG: threo-3-hydroxy-L-aspartate ammonia-lyase, partial [Gammaproteobacteria bacterium]
MMNTTPSEPVSFHDVLDASNVLKGHAHRTPVMRSRTLNDRLGAEVYFKCENLQRIGAFKFRGAFNAMSRLSAAEKARGVVAYSSGNHAQAVACVGRDLGIRTTIVMPRDVNPVKRDATAGYGAEVVLFDPQKETREAVAAKVMERHGGVLIPPFDHPHIIAGQGTAALEFLEEVELDQLLVPCGGGGLLSGCAVAAKGMQSSCKVIGIEPEQADDACRSFHSGVLQRIDNPQTIADGTRTASLGELTFALIQGHVDDMVSVSEAAIAEAVRFFFERMKLVVEPSGAVPLAALLDNPGTLAGRRVGVILSGGNVDLDAL